MSDFSIWVVSNGGNKEILRVVGNNRPPRAVCPAPYDPDTGKQITDLSAIQFQAYYYLPETSTTVNLENESSTPPSYYKNLVTSTWHTPVPYPVPQYWMNNGVWTNVLVTPSPEGVTPTSAPVITPEKYIEALIDNAGRAAVKAQDLTRLKNQVIARIEIKYKQLCAEDFLWTDGKYYQVSDDLRDGLNAVNTGLYTDRPWMAKDNTLRTFTVEEFKALGKAIFDRGDAYFVKKQIKKAEVNALTTEVQVNAYDVNAGWTA